jgi:hypothetical protein
MQHTLTPLCADPSCCEHLHTGHLMHCMSPLLPCGQSIEILAQLKPKYNVSAPTDRLVIGHMLRHR